MDSHIDEVSVWAISRYGRPESFGEYQRRSHAVLSALRGVHEKFESLAAISAHGFEVVPKDEAAFSRVVNTHAFSNENPQDYLRLEPSGRLGPESLSRIGFRLTYVSYDEAEKSLVAPAQGGVDVSLRGRSVAVESNTQAVITLPVKVECDLHLPEMIRKLLLITLSTWGCELGGVSLRRYEQRVNAADRASYAGQWLFYLPFPHLAKCLPPDIHHEPFANGILIETTPHMPDANNPADVEAGKRVRDVLDEFGLVNDATYAIEGWPPDREETIYEQYITGAPANRKYTVHCINFDGYDPDRKVLLYAKLFRRLKRHPKEWGLRNWDGPVINEAKRQVRAAAKAGGVPIEWHIGLEEPAHQVRQLLADYTDITEDKLRVIHTPLEDALSQT
jgi:hypothetical protein